MDKLPFELKDRTLIIKKESLTDDKYGKNPKDRSTEELLNNGVICLNKVDGPTSHQVADYVKKILKLEKVGHGGTLDPGVNGVLPIGLGKATRIMEALLKGGKEYICLMHIHSEIPEENIRKSSERFIGKIIQLPPVKSAVKRQLREREIYYIEILEIKGQDVLFRVGCQAGTYIRRLCLSPETEILTVSGIKKIKEVYDNKLNLEVFSNKNNELNNNNIIDFQRFNFEGELIEIVTYSGMKLNMTPDHKLLISTMGEEIMIEANKIKKGDFLVRKIKFPAINKKLYISELLDDEYLIHDERLKELCKEALIKKFTSIRNFYRKTRMDRKAFIKSYNIDIKIKHLKIAGIFQNLKNEINCFKTEKGKIINIDCELKEDLMYAIGLIASDGNNTKEKRTIRHTRIRFYNTEEILVNKFYEIIISKFPTIKISKKWKNKGIWEVETSNSLLATLCANLGVKSPYNKNDILPILELDNNLIKEFLKGYFDGDGHVNNNIKKSVIRIFSVNFKNIKRIHEMLLKIGIQNRILNSKIKNPKEHNGNKFYYNTEIIDPASKVKFCKEIGSEHPKKKERLNKIIEYFKDLNKEPEDYLYSMMNLKLHLKNIKGLNVILGGNYYKNITKNAPISRYIHKRLIQVNKSMEEPSKDFIAEEIISVKKVPYNGFVYDITVANDHNFLIENGIVSSNCDDWGRYLGTKAHMQELVRSKASCFNDTEWYTLHDLMDAFYLYKEENNDSELKKIIRPSEFAVSHLSKIWIIDSAVDTLCHGANLSVPGIAKFENCIEKNDLVAIFSLKDELISLGTTVMSSDEIKSSDKGIAVKSKKVFMEPEVYPHYKKN